MSAIKFSKQYIKPNPNEIDYWVDLSSNPYGGKWKYYNGVDWVDLINVDGIDIDFNNYYDKLLINQMLSEKASASSVESKVDDEEVADVVKNIEFKDRGDGGIEMVMLKYDDTTVGITLPIASNTTSGVITKESFKDFVKQNQLQQLYTTMYDTVADIRQRYQPRLSAGKNIVIDRVTNTIHATGKISTEWDDLVNVPDLALQPDLEKEIERATNAENVLDTRITSHVTTVETSLDLKADKSDTYTKSQIDSKLSGVYRIKGSCLFEELPTNPIVGDTWNIINDFTLNGEEHPFGTNVVYTDNGWDALAGIFDSSELEGDISGVSEALSQETIRAVKAEQANADAIVTEANRATKAEETLQSNIDVVDGKLVNYLPLSGGVLTSANAQVLTLKRSNAANPMISFSTSTEWLGNLGIQASFGDYPYNPIFVDKSNNVHLFWHSGNDGEKSGLDADLLDGVHLNETQKPYGGIPVVRSSDGIMEIGHSLDFNDNVTNDYATRLTANGSSNHNIVTLPSKTGTLALTTDNVASATKLATPVKIWGNNFDGSSDVNGNIISSNPDFFIAANSTLELLRLNNTNSYINLTYGAAVKQYNIYIYGKNLFFKTDTTADSKMVIANNGNVGIGTKNPMYKLDVEGQIASKGAVFANSEYNSIIIRRLYSDNESVKISILDNKLCYDVTNDESNAFVQYNFDCTDTSQEGTNGANAQKGTISFGVRSNGDTIMEVNHIDALDTGGGYREMIGRANDNSLYVGYGFPSKGYDSHVFGNNLYFKYGSESKTGMIINSKGYVGINYNNPFRPLCIYSTNSGDRQLIYLKNEMSNEASISYVTSSCGWVVGASTGGVIDGFGVYSSDSKNTPFAISKEGYVGIGTVTPVTALDVTGTGHFSNGLILDNSSHLSFKTTNDEIKNVLYTNLYNDIILGWDNITQLNQTFIDGYNIHFRTGENRVTGININSSGNVTIGSSDLASTTYKLFVNGKIKSNNDLILSTQSATNSRILMSNSEYGGIGIYSGVSEKDAVRIEPINKNGGWLAIGLTIDYSGWVGIGIRLPQARLHVEGNEIINGSLLVRDNITSGDYVDWYGVSWSEDSSDPTCTRIGNRALHRSLPILSAMKGYYIQLPGTNQYGINAECIIPLKEDWSGVKYLLTDNNSTVGGVSSSWQGNIMIKIPEFWYIDDYEPSTKTHNLKISQTAKAGWLHHKEAYVGAYEGYNDGTYYRSKKGVTPTVALSRTRLRSLARANGYEDEYKWNIYTYEEHRAICHLFLVEYATRNSQLAVNTALTADGFKQGGLGYGCTEGDVIINGVITYSFIPTGTTNSLGNGSGQVAYTTMLTDADGNETTAITRYANRYRGIENPFGHIWKHVDDIVSVYNAETTYKTVYKCNKPEHFATNKNSKYKPLCSFPGGTKMQGWSKEIKATINCDFFKYSVNGSESTYWCDYNYDVDDTTECCILAGGGSTGSGNGAGLFYFNLSTGVVHSAVTVGSRLTYLPWAE